MLFFIMLFNPHLKEEDVRTGGGKVSGSSDSREAVKVKAGRFSWSVFGSLVDLTQLLLTGT